MTLAQVAPTGQERLVGSDELFFSTTDARGVIRSANSVFERISGYPLERLVGSPHNLVRHPSMPAGIFRILWDRLQEGRPAAAYLLNLAADGCHYWVFATVIPVGDGYLSVRMAPRTTFFHAAQIIGARVLTAETAARRDGMSGADAAGLGALETERQLRRLDIASYDDFVMDALPAEVAARGALARGAFARPGARGGIGEVLAAAASLDQRLSDLVDRLDRYLGLSLALGPASRSLLTGAVQLARAVDAAVAGSAERAGDAQILRSVAGAMRQPAQETVGSLRELVDELDRLRPLVGDLRFRIALARLHNDMLAGFAAEMADGRASGAAWHGVSDLCRALQQGVTDLSAAIVTCNAALASVAALIDRAGARVNDLRRFLAKWRILVVRHRKHAELDPYTEPIDAGLDASHDHLTRLLDLGSRCRREIVPFDPNGLAGDLTLVRSALARV